MHGTFGPFGFGLRRFGGTEEATETGLTGLRWVVGSVLGLRPRLGETGLTGLKHRRCRFAGLSHSGWRFTGLKHIGGDWIRGQNGGVHLMGF